MPARGGNYHQRQTSISHVSWLADRQQLLSGSYVKQIFYETYCSSGAASNRRFFGPYSLAMNPTKNANDYLKTETTTLAPKCLIRMKQEDRISKNDSRQLADFCRALRKEQDHKLDPKVGAMLYKTHTRPIIIYDSPAPSNIRLLVRVRNNYFTFLDKPRWPLPDT